MKFLNKALCIVAFFVAGSVSARPMAGTAPARVTPPTPARQQIPAPQPVQVQPGQAPAKSFQYYLQEVRRKPSQEVINGQGVFTDSFIKFVHTSNLAPDFQLALFEAGRNLHLPLSGDNQKNKILIISTNDRIDDLKPIIVQLQPGQQQPVIAQPQPGPQPEKNIFIYASEFVKHNWNTIQTKMFTINAQGQNQFTANYAEIQALDDWMVYEYPNASAEERIRALANAFANEILQRRLNPKGDNVEQSIRNAIEQKPKPELQPAAGQPIDVQKLEQSALRIVNQNWDTIVMNTILSQSPTGAFVIYTGDTIDQAITYLAKLIIKDNKNASQELLITALRTAIIEVSKSRNIKLTTDPQSLDNIDTAIRNYWNDIKNVVLFQ